MQKSSLNILLVHNKYRYAGGEDSVVQNECALLRAHGHNVILYQKDNIELDHYSLLKKLFLPFRTIYSLSSAREIRSIIQKEQIDIVHVHNTLPLISFSSYYAAKRYGCTLVQTLHNFRFLCPNGLFYRDNSVCLDCLQQLSCSVKHSCYRSSKLQTALVALNLWLHRKIGTFSLPDAYIALTEFNKNIFTRIYPEIKLYVKPNFTAIPDSSSLFCHKKSREYFIYVSRLEKSKGIFMLLEAFRQLADITLLIVGTGPDETAVHDFITKNQMKNVRLNGHTSHSEVLSLLYHAKALLFPTQWYEGFPVVLAESFSVGTPVIGSNIGNTAAIIKHNKTGLLFQHNNTADFVDRIKEFCSEAFLFQSMEENCIQEYKTLYSPEKNYELLYSIYTSAEASKS